MKRKISLILVLAMVLSVMLPFGALAAEENANQELFNKIYDSRIGKALRETSITSQQLINLARDLEDNVDEFITDTFEVINENEELVNFLSDKYKIDKDVASNLASTIIEWGKSEENKELIKSMAEKMENGDSSPLEDTELECIQKLRNKINTEFSDQITSINNVLKDKNQKIELTSALMDAVLKNLKFEEKNENKDLKIILNKEGLNTEIKKIEDEYLIEDEDKSEYKLTSLNKTKAFETLDNLIPVLEKYYDIVESKAVKNGVGTKQAIRAKLKTLVGEENYKEYESSEPSDDKPSTGGGGGTTAPSTGGGSGTTPAKPETPPAKIIVTDESIKAVLGEDDIKVTKKDGVATVEVEEDKALATVEAMAKEAEERDAVLVVEAKDVEDMNAAVSLPGSVALELEDKKVNVEIVTKEIEYNVPYNAINTENVDKNSKIELRSKEVTNDLTNEIGEVKSAVDLSMVLIKDKKETVITNFNAPIEVKINVKGKGNYAKLAAYYLNEEDNTLEFVSGHIENDKLIMKLDHFSKYVIIESTKTFPDIADHWAKENIESMVAKNIINGYEDGTFRPEEKITRAEFVKMIVNALNAELVEYDNEFSDVKASDWHADYIATANALGLINGYTDGTFRPNATIKRAEMASILAKVVDDEEVYEEDIEALKTKFNDYKDIPEWALESVAKVVKAGLMNGTGKGFSPNNDTTRAEGATTVYRVYMK